jgi:ATP-dependent protease ClpP protease subunit
VRNDEAEILLYDEIGFFGIRAQDFVRDLKAIEAATIHLRLNSPGGDVFEGLTIFNALRQHGAKIVAHVDGFAASIASVIALAGEEVRMAENAFFMIHNPFTITIGDAADHRKTAEVLDKVEGTLAGVYVAKTDAGEEQVAEWMAAETWFTAEEAKDAGFADAIDGPAAESEAAARWDLSVFEHAPAALAARERPPTVREVERLLRDAGFSRSEAEKVASQGMPALTALSPRDAGDESLDELDRLITTLTGVKP